MNLKLMTLGKNLISESFAKEHNIRITSDSILTSGVKKGYSKIGTTDSIMIGDIVYYNPVFIVAPTNEEVDTVFKVDTVLGIEFMKSLKGIQIFPQKELIILSNTSSQLPKSGKNMIMNGDQPLLLGFWGKEKLIFQFDTGNAGADLHETFYTKNKKWVEKKGKKHLLNQVVTGD